VDVPDGAVQTASNHERISQSVDGAWTEGLIPTDMTSGVVAADMLYTTTNNSAQGPYTLTINYNFGTPYGLEAMDEHTGTLTDAAFSTPANVQYDRLAYDITSIFADSKPGDLFDIKADTTMGTGYWKMYGVMIYGF
jgi:hypothetical protein